MQRPSPDFPEKGTEIVHDILILNTQIVNEQRIWEGDLAIRNGRIDQIGADLQSLPAKQVIDAAGKYLLPGMIDDQVHFREPGLTYKADLFTESCAAAAGGITSYMEMPNTRPPAVDLDLLEEKYQRAARKSMLNYSFYLGAANDNLEQVKRVDPRKICGIKVFMGASTGNMLVDDPQTLEDLFRAAPTLIAAHCEDTPTIEANLHAIRERFGEDIPAERHPEIRSAEACYKSSSLAIELARAQGARLHILHISTARELELFGTVGLSEKRITVEACVHHLFFDDRDYEAKQHLIKCNPAIKTRQDREALLAALREGRIDVIGTDHAPHTWAEKQQPYLQAPAGLPLVQDALPSLMEHFFDGRISLELIAEKTAHHPALLFGVRERGFIREGFWADLVLINPDAARTVDRSGLYSKCGWSPFEGYTFRSTVESTIVNGKLIYQQGMIFPERAGMRLQFDRNHR